MYFRIEIKDQAGIGDLHHIFEEENTMSQSTESAYHKELAKYFKTEKHNQFSTNFFIDAESYEAWDEIDFSNLEEVDGENTFTIKAEDLKFYAEGCLDDNPYMTDEEFAKKSPYGGLVSSSLIYDNDLVFGAWGSKRKRELDPHPGARAILGINHVMLRKFQGWRIQFTLSFGRMTDMKKEESIIYSIDIDICIIKTMYMKASSFTTLILPRTRDDIRKFLKGIRGLQD